MEAAWFLASLIMGQTATLAYKEGSFEIKTPAQSLIVSTERYVGPAPFPSDNVTLSYSGRQITFDSKGLGIRQGNAYGYSKLPSLAMTTKLFGNKEIAETKAKISSGERQAGFSALSGFEYVGTTLYLLLRWEEKSGQPWLEALVGLDMSQKQLQPKLIGRFDGVSFAKGIVDDRLESWNGGLAAFTVNGEEWGLATMTPENGAKNFVSYGAKAAAARLIPGGLKAIGMTPTNYGTTLVTLVDLATQRARLASEVRGQIRGLVEPNILHWREGSQNVFTNLETGAELRPTWDSVPVTTSLGLLVYSPSLNPERAALYDPVSFRQTASWVKPPTPPVIPAPSAPTGSRAAAEPPAKTGAGARKSP